MSPETAVRNRWLGFLIWQPLLSTPVFLLSTAARLLSHPLPTLLVHLPLFLLSLLIFSLALSLPSSPHPDPAASPSDLLLHLFRLLFFSLVSAGSDRQHTDQGLLRRAATSARLVGCLLLSGVSGFLSAVTVCGGVGGWGRVGLKGAVFGLVYGGWFVWARRWVLRFPIIQRPLFFSFKIGLPSSLKQALMLSCISFVCTTIFMLFIPEKFQTTSGMGKLVVEQITFFFGIFIISFCWEQSCHLLQVIHTRRCCFAPPKGSAAAEMNPSEPLLVALEQSTPRSLGHYLAYLDLCIVCESNVDAWRRAAFFEETGETYKKVVVLCIRPLEQLTLALAKGLDGMWGSKAHDLSRQLQSPADAGADPKLHEVFNSFQLYAWCARSVSALTAHSHNEDRFGVAQLTGSNASVVSSLLSCLLAVEACLGKKTSPQSAYVIGPAKIKWATVNTGRRDVPSTIVSKKQTGVLYSKAYAMADVLRTSIYEIVSAFHEEMEASVKTSSLEKDWIPRDKYLYGTREILLQKLSQFLDFRA